MRLRKIWYRLYIRRLAFRWLWKVNLGDGVRYRGDQWIVANGVNPGSWTLQNQDGRVEAPRNEVRKIWTVRNMIGSWRSAINFYESYWLDTWVHSGIQPWMRSCKIWGRR